jgi:hypothetical protein
MGWILILGRSSGLILHGVFLFVFDFQELADAH